MKSRFWPLALLLSISAFAFWPFLKSGFFPIHDSLQFLRLFEMERCFLDGQLPCRWAPDLGGGFGLPLFNYYSPLVYYLGMVFRFLGFSFVWSVKLLFLTGIILSGFSMYLLAREFWGKFGGLISATLYIFAPFHALDIYARGDLAEFFALAILPVVFWSFYKLIKTGKKQFILLSGLSLAVFALSHNITVFLSLPLFVVWICFWLLTLKRMQTATFVGVFFSGLVGFGLAAFFLIPAWFEQGLVQLQGLTVGYFDFRGHFITLGQLFFDRSWGFGISRFGPTDTLSFQIGWPHWWLVIVSFGLAIIKGRKIREKGFDRRLIFLMTGLFLGTLFMIHPRSVFIWERLPLLSFVQFPWRLLGLAAFISSFLAGFVIFILSREDKKKLHLLTAFIIGLVLVLNFSYFSPKEFLPLEDKDFLTGEVFQKEQQDSVYDFLPKGVLTLPIFETQAPQIISGEAGIIEFVRRSDYFKVNVEVYGLEKAKILVPVFNYPDWQVFIDEVPVSIESNPWGLIQIESPPGKHEISGWFRNTKIRVLGNVISIATLFLVIYLLASHDRKNKKSKK